jgi:hypothetical protein
VLNRRAASDAAARRVSLGPLEEKKSSPLGFPFPKIYKFLATLDASSYTNFPETARSRLPSLLGADSSVVLDRSGWVQEQ